MSSKLWTVEKLPPLPKETGIKISRQKITINLTISTIFGGTLVLLLSKYQEAFGWYDKGILVVLLFNPQIITIFIPFLIGLISLNILVQGIILCKGYWKTNITIIYSFYQIISLLIVMFFIWHPQLISDNFVTYIESVSNGSGDSIILGLNVARGIVSSVLILTTIIDTLIIWYKLYKFGGLKKVKN